MPVDARIPLGATVPQAPNIVQPYVTLAQLRHLQQQEALGQLQFQEAQQRQQERTALRDVFRQPGMDLSTPEGRSRLVAATSQVSPEYGMQLRGTFMAQDKAAREARKAELEYGIKRVERLGQIAASVRDQSSYSRALQQAAAEGFPIEGWAPEFTPEMQAKLEDTKRQALGIEGQLKQEWQAKQFDLDERRLAETARGHTLTAETAAERTSAILEGQKLTAAAQERAARIQGRSAEEAARIAGQKAYEAAVAKPMEGEARLRTNLMMQARDITETIATEFTPAEIKQYVGALGARKTLAEWQQLLDDVSAGRVGQKDPKFARFAALNATLASEAFSIGGKALTPMEASVVFGYIPTGKELTAESYLQKLKLSQQRLPALIEREITISTTPQRELLQRYQSGQLPAITAPPGATGETTLTLPDGRVVTFPTRAARDAAAQELGLR